MAVLDAGCGTGSITAGMAAAVGPAGRVTGLDRDESLIAIARHEHAGVTNLGFETGDLLTLGRVGRFDIVTAARLIQWIGNPAEAIGRMAMATRPGGRVVVLDYNHDLNSWTPEPPAEFRRFWSAFLDWRGACGWDNRMGDHLHALFEDAGLKQVTTYSDDELVRRGEPEFAGASAIWLHVIQTLGPSFMTDEAERLGVETAYAEYAGQRLETQCLSMRTTIGEA